MEYPDTTLNSPLTNHLSTRLVHFLESQDPEEDKRHRQVSSDNLPRQLASSLLRLLGPGSNRIQFKIHDASMTPDLMNLSLCDKKDRDRARQSLSAPGEVVVILAQAVARGLKEMTHPLTDKVEIPNYVPLVSNLLDPTEDLIDAYLKVCYWQSFIDTATQKVDVNRTWAENQQGWVNRHLTAILTKGQWVILPHDAVLMIKDIVWGRFLLELYSVMDSSRRYISTNIRFVHQWGFRGLKKYGDMAYNLIKMIEPLCTARLICLSEKILDHATQYNNMEQKYIDKEREISEDKHLPEAPIGTSMARQFSVFLGSISDPNQISEIFSLAKMVGHPYIDPIAGSNALKDLARTESKATYSGVKAVEWSFCHMFTKGFIDKRKKWPPLVFNLPPGKKSRLRELHDQEHMPLPLGLSIYDPSDWDYVTFLPVDQFDYGTDILSLMSDKSLSYKRSEVDASWSGRLSYTPDKPTSSKRVLEQLLVADLDMRKICDAFSSRTIPWDWRIVVVQPKERESKTPVARNFAIMTIEPRSFFCLSEQNLAEKIYPFIPEQTMTMPAAEKEKIFLDVTRPHTDGCTLSITLDLSKWCSHFRRQNVMMVAERLNQLLGVEGIFGAVHDFFEMCLIILRHPSFTPKQDVKGKKGNLNEEPGIYTDAETGLEGICQKLWTLITLCMLHWALWKFGLTYKITCQGDNLVAYISVHRGTMIRDEFTSHVRDLNTRILKSVSEAASMIGHDVNPDECFSSTSFTTYGKDMWFNGVKLETISKVVSRMFPKTSSDVPSTESIVSNIAATGTSLVERTNDSLSVFFFTKFIECLVLRREMQRSMVHQSRFRDTPESIFITDNSLGSLTLSCLVPSNLGGFPVSSLAEFMYRGHSDPLSSSVGSLSFLSSIPVISKFLACLEDPLLVGIDNLALVGTAKFFESRMKLVRDPYSIPIRKVAGATQQTSEHIKTALRSRTRNKQLKAIVNIATDTHQEKALITCLLKTKPVNPKILHEIHKTSVFGLGNAIARRFTDTRTVRRMAKDETIDLVSAHVENDYHHIRATLCFLGGIIRRPKMPRIMSSFKLLVHCRLQWGLGVLEGVTNYHPLVAGKLIMLPVINISGLSRFIQDEENPILAAVSLIDSTGNCSSMRGSRSPYLGNMTSEKVVSKWTKPIDASPPLKDALRMIQIAKQCTESGSPFRELIFKLASGRTSLPIDVLMEMSQEQVGGTSIHRFNISTSLRGSSNASLPNWSTHFNISSNLSRQMGAVDYPISFSEYYLSLITIGEWVFKGQEIEAPFGLLHHIDLRELEPLHDTMIQLEDRIELKMPMISRDNYYLYATSMTLSARSKIGKVMPLGELAKVEARPVDALTVIFLSQMTGTVKTIRKSGYKRSQTNLGRVVDLPEASLITLSDYIDSAALAVGLYSARFLLMRLNKNSDTKEMMLEVLLAQSLILSPLIFSTVALACDNKDEQLRLSAGFGISERGLIHLACKIASKSTQMFSLSTVLPPVFDQTKGAMSTALSTRLYFAIAQFVLDEPRHTRSGKFLCRLIRLVMQRIEEEDRVAGLCHLISFLHWETRISIDEKSSEARIRGYRNSIKTTLDDFHCEHYQLPPLPRRSCVITDARLELEPEDHPMSPELQIESWSRRPFPGKSDAHLRWSAISTHLVDGESVYVIGIGAGGILRCIPGKCDVYGLDLPKTLSGLGQSFVNYSSAFEHPHYSTRPLSWVRDLSALTSEDISYIMQDVRQCCADTVLIDVDGVPTQSRISLRNRISTDLGANCWVKLHSTPRNIQQIKDSLDASRGLGDDWWEPEISVGTELIFGKGSRPLALNSALGGPAVDRVLVVHQNRPSWDELVEFVSHFGGGLEDISRLGDAIHDVKLRSRKSEGRSTAFDVYSLSQTDPAKCLFTYSRYLVRICLVVVPWFL
jgi:hypothetical protein